MNEIATARALPRQLDCDGEAVTLRLMEAADGPAVLAFAGALPGHDLLFLRRDISRPKVIAAWMQSIAEGRLHSLAVRHARGA